MRILSKTLRAVSSALITLASLAMLVLEGTLMVTGDFLLYEDSVIAFFQVLIRVLIPLSMLLIGIFSFIKSRRSFLLEGTCVFASVIVMMPFISNGFGIYFALAGALFALSQLLWHFNVYELRSK